MEVHSGRHLSLAQPMDLTSLMRIMLHVSSQSTPNSFISFIQISFKNRRKPWTCLTLKIAVAFTYAQIDLLTRITQAYPSVFASPPTPSSKSAIQSFKDGLLISPIGIEGLHQIGNAVSNLRHYYALGVRYSTLSHNCHNVRSLWILFIWPKKSSVTALETCDVTRPATNHTPIYLLI